MGYSQPLSTLKARFSPHPPPWTGVQASIADVDYAAGMGESIERRVAFGQLGIQ